MSGDLRAKVDALQGYGPGGWLIERAAARELIPEGPWLTDEYQEETNAAMNYGDGYRAAELELAEADFIAATRRLDSIRRELGKRPIGLEDLATRQGGRGEDEEQAEGRGDGERDAAHGVAPVRGLNAADRTRLRNVSIELADSTVVVPMEDIEEILG